VAIGAALAPIDWALTLGAIGGTVAPAALRALRMKFASGIERPPSLVQAFLVAYSYDMGRALALVARVGHGTRRRQPIADGVNL
jgi:hypothetical protein